MIYTDGRHLISDQGKTELIEFGKKIGFKSDFLTEAKGYEYFILENIHPAINAGAKQVSIKELREIMKRQKKTQFVPYSQSDWTNKQIQTLKGKSEKLKLNNNG